LFPEQSDFMIGIIIHRKCWLQANKYRNSLISRKVYLQKMLQILYSYLLTTNKTCCRPGSGWCIPHVYHEILLAKFHFYGIEGTGAN